MTSNITGAGELIRQKRVIKGYSQEYMAFQLSISQNAYSKIEREETEITLKRLYDIAEIFKISIEELLPKPKDGSGLNLSGLKKAWEKITGLFKKKISSDLVK